MVRCRTALWASIAASLVLTGCLGAAVAQQTPSATTFRSSTESAPSHAAPSLTVLTPGSELTITVWTGKAVHVFTRARIAADSTLTLPRLAPLNIGGKSLAEALTLILDAYRAIYPECSVDAVPTLLVAPERPLFGTQQPPADVTAPPTPDGATTSVGVVQPGTVPPGTGPDGAAPTEPVIPPTPRSTPVNPAEAFAMLPRFGADTFLNPQVDAATPPAVAGRPAVASSTDVPGTGSEPAWSPLANVPVPATYEIGPGDELDVQVWSRNNMRSQTRAVVSADGGISVPIIGQVVVSGKTRGELGTELEARLATYYDQPTVVIELLRQRTVEVFVSGSVVRPGRLSLPPNATVLTALYAAGGPSDTGSYRHIKLLRADGKDTEIDLYDFLMYGQRAADEPLGTGDRLFVPSVRSEIGIAGSVRRAARYEIDDAVTVADALEMASGLRPDGYAGGIEIWRPDGRTAWALVRADATRPGEFGAQMQLHDGDLVKVGSLVEEAFDAVEVRGPVNRPGMYPTTPGLTVSALLKQAQGPTPEAFMEEGVIWRLNDDLDYEIVRFSVRDVLAGTADPALQARDIVHLYLESDVQAPATVQVEGAVLRPGTAAFVRGMRVRDLILAAGDLLPGAYTERAEVLRVTPEQKTLITPVNLAQALAGSDADNIRLQRGDTLKVIYRSEVTGQSQAHIAGAVRKEGSYPRHEGMRVSDLIIAAGGLQPEFDGSIHFTPGRFTGPSTTRDLRIEGTQDAFTIEPDLVLSDDDHVGVMSRPDFTIVPEIAQVQGRVQTPGTYALRTTSDAIDATDTADTVYDVLQRAGGLLPDANPRGIVLYRLREEVLPEANQAELNYVLSILNREGAQVDAALSDADQTQVLSSGASEEVAQLLGTTQGALLVVPPRRLGIAHWIKAVPVDGERLLATEGSQGNLALHPGDIIQVPKIVDFVTVIGSVNSPHAVPYVGERKASLYVEMAGGPTDDAAMDRIIVMRANGATLPADRAKDIQPGDVIVVPSEHMFRAKHVGGGWTETLRSLLSIAAAALAF